MAIGLGTAALLSGASTGLKIFGSNKREKDVNEAQQRKEASDRLIRSEQAGRVRRNQIKQAQVASANSEAMANATGATNSSGAINSQSAVSTNLADNLGNLNTDLATGNIDAALSQNLKNSGRPSDFELFNNVVSPGLQAGLSNSIANAFKKPD